MVLEAGAYWGAYKPVLTALQATGTLDALPLGDCLLRSDGTDRAPGMHFLLATCYFLLPASYFLLPTSHFLLPTCYFLPPTSYLLLPTEYLKHAAPPSRKASTQSLAALAEGAEGADPSGVGPVGGYDIRPILNVSAQETAYRIADVRREWPSASDGATIGSSLDAWQLKAAKALLTRLQQASYGAESPTIPSPPHNIHAHNR